MSVPLKVVGKTQREIVVFRQRGVDSEECPQ